MKIEQLAFPLDENDNPLYLDCLYKDLSGYIEQVNTSKRLLDGFVYINPDNKTERYIIALPTLKDIQKSYPYLYNSQILAHVESINSKARIRLEDYYSLEESPFEMLEYRAGGYSIYCLNDNLTFQLGSCDTASRTLKIGDLVTEDFLNLLDKAKKEVSNIEKLFEERLDFNELRIIGFTLDNVSIRDKASGILYTIPHKQYNSANSNSFIELMEKYIEAKKKKPSWVKSVLKRWSNA